MKNNKSDVFNAQHPNRQKAIQIIEEVIEPFFNTPINGEKYYSLEDKITKIINK